MKGKQEDQLKLIGPVFEQKPQTSQFQESSNEHQAEETTVITKQKIRNQVASGIYDFRVNQVPDKKDKRFKSNMISTCKYTWWNFIPKNLFIQFTKLANAYFLLILILQVIKPVSITKGTPAILLPLSVVVAMSAIKDIIEDFKRYRSDQAENRKKCLAKSYITGQFELTEWEQLKVGQTVKILQDEPFPADILLINSSLNGGIAYVETKNLDGETNLKHKNSVKEVIPISQNENQVLKFEGHIFCEAPNDRIYKFEGNMNSQSLSKEVSLSADNILLRGASLRNTDHIYGVVVFTGHDTKIMLNSSSARNKFSRNEQTTNVQILLVFMLQLSVCFFGSMFGTIWERDNRTETYNYLKIELLYSESENRSWTEQFFTRFGTWILLFTNFIPISLTVTIEVVRMAQGFFMSWDTEIYDLEKDMSTKVQSSNLNEELGQVHYIFSDKTGTLTCNIMEFKKFSVGEVSYGIDGFNLKDKMANRYPNFEQDNITNVNFEDPVFFEHLNNHHNSNYKNIQNYLDCLALCHTVIIEEKDGKIFYNASSPDELALVNAAKFFGVAFAGRDEQSNMIIKRQNGGTQTFELLNVLEFNSTRKRMSVIIKDQHGQIKLICKGADSIIEQRLKKSQENQGLFQKTDVHLQQYAKDGLRTLLIAERILDPNYYLEWSKDYYQASLLTKGRDDAIDECAEKIEVELSIVGSTAIEDLLQEKVGETIFSLKEAGIKVWVLTGDKIETAINIGYSCQLLNNDMLQVVIDGSNGQEIIAALNDAEIKVKENRQDQKIAIIVSGGALIDIAAQKQIQDQFIDVCSYAQVVLACRVSPKQKADIVNMIKDKYPSLTTLAIGDGANDVNMITAAHIGVGISGKEGQQAARAADYAIGQFKFLQNLLFVHGRESYRRNSYLICYMFYKNALYVMPQFWYGIVNTFSGQTLYESWVYQLFNIVFTALPIMWYALFDSEFDRKDLHSDPKKYANGPAKRLFNKTIFWKWMLYATCKAVLIMFLLAWTFENSLNRKGQTSSFWVYGMIVYSIIVILVNVEILFQTNNHNFVSIIIFIGSIASFYAVYAVENTLDLVPTLQGTFFFIWISPQYYLVIIFMVLLQLFVQMTQRDLALIYYDNQDQQQGVHKNLKVQQENHQYQTTKNIQSETPGDQSRFHRASTHKGFAFSQERGNDPIVMERLPTNKQIQKMMSNNFEKQNSMDLYGNRSNKVAPLNASIKSNSIMQADQSDLNAD
eukprot:403343827